MIHNPIISFVLLILLGCTTEGKLVQDKSINQSDLRGGNSKMDGHLTTDNYVRDIVNHNALQGYGELMLTLDNNSNYYGIKLSDIGSLMPYHGNVHPEEVIWAINHMIDEANQDKKIFYNFYSDDQKQQDPGKKYTGLFFFRGKPDAPFAIICPGGGFSYVGSLHEGFPLAAKIRESGLNAFVIRYRLGSEQFATSDLAAAIAFVFRNSELLKVSTKDYSVWGGSAGARMAGNIALNGVSAYGGGDLPKPATAVIAYTGQSSWSENFSPAFITVAANDGIANVNVVDRRVENLRNAGVDVEYRRYESAGHGFGLGTGTDAEGWLNLAIQFWLRHVND